MKGGDMGQGTRDKGQSTVEYLVVATAIILVIATFVVPQIAMRSGGLMNEAINAMDGQ